MSDDVTFKNIMAIKVFSEDTRQLTRSTQEELNNAKNSIRQLESAVALLETQLRLLQVKVFSGGATQ